MTRHPALEITDLHKSHGDHAGLRGIDLSAAPATVVGLLGPKAPVWELLMELLVERGMSWMATVDHRP